MTNEIENKIKEMVDAELTELKEDIALFRDLEQEYATKLTEEKIRLGEKLREELAVLTARLESFCVDRLTSELNQYPTLSIKNREKINTSQLMESVVDCVITDKLETAEFLFHVWLQAYLQEKTE